MVGYKAKPSDEEKYIRDSFTIALLLLFTSLTHCLQAMQCHLSFL